MSRPNVDLKFGCDIKAMKKMQVNQFDWGIVDPEWGRKQHGGVKRAKWVTQKNGSKFYVSGGNQYDKKDWDNAPAQKEYFDQLFRVTRKQIIWGCNYYDYKFGSGRIIWDKCNEGSDQSDCEIAYVSTTSRVDLFRYMWRGMMQGKSAVDSHMLQGNKMLNEQRIHPTQKPVILYKWLLDKYVRYGETVLDTHLGSGSIAIACLDRGIYLEAYEIDRGHYDDANKRVSDYKVQLPIDFNQTK